MSKIKVVIVDDQKLFAGSLKIVLEGYAKEEIEVVGVAANGKESLEMVERTKPDIVLMDVRMPLMDGVEATKIIVQKHPKTRVIILTTFDDDEYVIHGLKNGAIGYLLKSIEPEDLIASVKTVHSSGQLMVSPTVAAKLISHTNLGEVDYGTSPVPENERAKLRMSFPNLRRREVEILCLMRRNLDNHEIAEKLFIADQTVKNYISRIYDKLDVPGRSHAIQLANQIVDQ